MDHAMPYDAIAPAGGYVQSPRIGSMLSELRKLSAERVAKDRDLQNNVWYADYRKRLQKENSISLNKQTRQAQINELRNFKKQSDEDRKKRYEMMSKEDEKNMAVYRLNLEDVHAAELPRFSEKDKESFMREAKDPEDDLEESLDYPSGLDPVLREALYIVRDMVNLR